MKVKKLFLTLFTCIVIDSFLIIPAFAVTRHITISDIGSGCYSVSPATFSVSAGQTITVSWTDGKKLNMFLYNHNANTVTTFESSTSSISYTGMTAGNYDIHVHDVSNNYTGPYSEKFTISDSKKKLIQPKVKVKKKKLK